MSDFVQVPADSVGKKIDAASLDVGVDTVYRQRVVIGDNTGTASYAVVTGGALNVNLTSTVTVAGSITLAAGANNIGTINGISAAVKLAAGTNNIGLINNISAPVVLAAGTNNIGFINNISAPVVLAAGASNIGTINGISASVLVATGASFDLNTLASADQVQTVIGFALALPGSGGAVAGGTATNPIIVGGTIDKISATVQAAIGGQVGHSLSVTAGNAPILVGLRCHLSASAAVANLAASYAWGDRFGRQVIVNNHPSLLPTASHGPRCVTLSTSATVALVAAPGAGLAIYVTKIACTNGSATLTRGDVYPASATAASVLQMYMAASGGGFVMDYNPPVQILSNTALNARVKPNVSQCIFNVHFYVGPK